MQATLKLTSPKPLTRFPYVPPKRKQPLVDQPT